MSLVNWICCIFLLQGVVKVKATHLDNDLRCDFATNLTVGNRTVELSCCDKVVEEFYQKWHFGRFYLSTLLETLQTWHCPQLEEECKSQLFSYTDFTSLMYLRFCNRSVLETRCFDDVRSVVKAQTGGPFSITTWKDAVNNLNLEELGDDDLLKPCLQVAMYDLDEGGHGHYHEVVEPIAPFCSFIWCGFDESIVEARDISAWTCMPSSCQSSIIVVMVVFGLLAVATFVCNATILGVLLRNKKLQNGQAIYRLSLAFADILVGAIVFPTFISTLDKYFVFRHELGEIQNVTGYVRINDTEPPVNSTVVQVRETSGLFRDRFSPSYLNAIGFFTLLSLFISVYSLMAAGIDRFIAINKPLRYNQNTAVFGARITVVGIWIVGVLFATFPLYVSNLRYGVVAAILVSPAGREVVILYSVIFIIPLIVMWFLTIATFVLTKMKSSEWTTQTREREESQMAMEIKLFRTLGVMVAVFSLCLIPSVLVLLIGLYLPDIYYNNPEVLDEQVASRYVSAEVIAVLLLTSNSLWNCFIYSARDPRFRNASKLMYIYIAQALRLDYAWNIIARRDRSLSDQRRRSQPMRQDSVSSIATEATKVYYKNNQVDMKYNATTQ